MVLSGRGSGARGIAECNVAGFARRGPKKKPRCQLLTARPVGEENPSYFAELIFCAFM